MAQSTKVKVLILGKSRLKECGDIRIASMARDRSTPPMHSQPLAPYTSPRPWLPRSKHCHSETLYAVVVIIIVNTDVIRT